MCRLKSGSSEKSIRRRNETNWHISGGMFVCAKQSQREPHERPRARQETGERHSRRFGPERQGDNQRRRSKHRD